MAAIMGHEHLQRELAALARAEAPPHALLLTGAEGTGRRTLALEYLRLLNCERLNAPPTTGASLFGDDLPPVTNEGHPCGECRPCRLISEGTHPDVITVSPGDTLCTPRGGDSSHARHPESRDIRICQVRGVIDLAARFPFEANYRGVILDPADKITIDAANTLLKTLEEPPGHSIFLLLSSAPEMLLETVVSRCRKLEVRPVATAAIETGLIERGIAPVVAARAAAEARGKPGRALEFAAHPDLMDDRARLLERCAKVAGQASSERWSYSEGLAERWRQDRSLVHGELDAWEEFWERRLRAAAGMPGNTGAAREALAALEAVALARTDLQAQVQARIAIELMLISFPRVKIAANGDPGSIG